jgi:hypothetical protein
MKSNVLFALFALVCSQSANAAFCVYVSNPGKAPVSHCVGSGTEDSAVSALAAAIKDMKFEGSIRIDEELQSELSGLLENNGSQLCQARRGRPVTSTTVDAPTAQR